MFYAILILCDIIALLIWIDATIKKKKERVRHDLIQKLGLEEMERNRLKSQYEAECNYLISQCEVERARAESVQARAQMDADKADSERNKRKKRFLAYQNQYDMALYDRDTARSRLAVLVKEDERILSKINSTAENTKDREKLESKRQTNLNKIDVQERKLYAAELKMKTILDIVEMDFKQYNEFIERSDKDERSEISN